MLRTTLNFAAHPIRNYALYSMAFRTAFLVLAGITCLHGLHAWRAFSARAEEGAALAEARAAELRLQTEVNRMEGRLQGAEVAELQAKAAWVNALVTTYRFSWTALLDDLESVLTPSVFVQTIAPSRADDGAAEIKLSVVARTPADLADFLDALEDARRASGRRIFVRAYPSGEKENLIPGIGSVIVSDITVTYLPENAEAREGAEPS